MSDIQIVWNIANGRGDWSLNAAGNDVLTGNDLATAVYVSLFSDRRAAEDDAIPDNSGDPRGWWGDTGSTYPIGSRIWLLSRAKATADTLAKAKDYIVEALQWLIDDGVAASIDVLTEWTQPNMLGAQVTIHRTSGAAVALNFSNVWVGIA